MKCKARNGCWCYFHIFFYVIYIYRSSQLLRWAIIASTHKVLPSSTTRQNHVMKSRDALFAIAFVLLPWRTTSLHASKIRNRIEKLKEWMSRRTFFLKKFRLIPAFYYFDFLGPVIPRFLALSWDVKMSQGQYPRKVKIEEWKLEQLHNL